MGGNQEVGENESKKNYEFLIKSNIKNFLFRKKYIKMEKYTKSKFLRFKSPLLLNVPARTG